MRRAGLVLLLTVGLIMGCGDRLPRVPTGDPLEVVRASADLTERTGRVTVFVDSPGDSESGEVHLVRDVTSGDIHTRFDIRERARAALDIARLAVAAEAYGGQQVRGVSTMRYEVKLPGGWEADVWVDVTGRVRRVQFADSPSPETPHPTQPNGLPALVTVDFVFPEAQLKGGGTDR